MHIYTQIRGHPFSRVQAGAISVCVCDPNTSTHTHVHIYTQIRGHPFCRVQADAVWVWVWVWVCVCRGFLNRGCVRVREENRHSQETRKREVPVMGSRP